MLFTALLLPAWSAPCLLSSSRVAAQTRTPPACRTKTTSHHVFPFPVKERRKQIGSDQNYPGSWNIINNSWDCRNKRANREILTLFLWALIEAYRTVPLNPATGRGWERIEYYSTQIYKTLQQINTHKHTNKNSQKDCIRNDYWYWPVWLHGRSL